MNIINKISTWPVKDFFPLIEAIKKSFDKEVSLEWFGSKKTSVLRVKINYTTNLSLVVDEMIKNNQIWNKLDVFSNKKGDIVFEVKPYDFGYMELADFMKKNKINNRQSVWNYRDRIEKFERSSKWIYYRFKA